MPIPGRGARDFLHAGPGEGLSAAAAGNCGGWWRQRDGDASPITKMTIYHKAMKLAFLCLYAVMVCSSSMAAQSWRDNRSQLCFVRYEDNGAMNTLQSLIRVPEYEVPVIGGQAVCLYVEPGREELMVTSTIPYDLHSTDANACKSRALTLELKAGRNRTFIVEPATKGSSYICGWGIKLTRISQ